MAEKNSNKQEFYKKWQMRRRKSLIHFKMYGLPLLLGYLLAQIILKCFEWIF